MTYASSAFTALNSVIEGFFVNRMDHKESYLEYKENKERDHDRVAEPCVEKMKPERHEEIEQADNELENRGSLRLEHQQDQENRHPNEPKDDQKRQ